MFSNPALEALEYGEELYRLYQDAKTKNLIENIMKAGKVTEGLQIYRQVHPYKIGFDIFSLSNKDRLRERIGELRHDLKILGLDWPGPSTAVGEYLGLSPDEMCD